MATTARWPIDRIQVVDEVRRDLGDLAGLQASIEHIGLLHPIVVTLDGRLIAGLRRLAACLALGHTEIAVTVVDNLDDALTALQASRDENAQRKALSPEEAVRLAQRLAPLEREAARARQALAGRATAGDGDACAELAQADKARTRDRLAQAVGLSHQTLTEAAAVVAAADAEPQVYGDLLVQMNTTGKVHGIHQRLQQRRLALQLAAQPLPPPSGPFEVIVADPPWKYPGTGKVHPPYPMLSVEEISAIDVVGLAAPDALCALWTTNTHLPYAFDVLRCWASTTRRV